MKIICPFCGSNVRPGAEDRRDGVYECECGTLFILENGKWRAVAGKEEPLPLEENRR